jgi:hypothetical protein
MIITTFILCWLESTQVKHPDRWLEPYPGSTPESDLKTMIITIFTLTLIWINDQTHLWPKPCPGLTIESGFKTMIIFAFILTLTQVNRGQPDPWLRHYLESKPKSGFKTMIINIFILTLTRVNRTHDLDFVLNRPSSWVLKLW